MNGVLVDDEPIQERAWTQTLTAAGIVLEEGWFSRHFLGRKVSATLASVFPDLDESEHAKLIADKRGRYEHTRATEGLPVVAGVVEMLMGARARGLLQAVVTSSGAADVDAVMDLLRVRHLFDAFIYGSDVKEGKPAPECFLLAATRLEVPPRECWVIEDSVAGVRAAKAAGMKCLAVTTSFSSQQLSEADIITDGFSDELISHLR
jgi:HAD superfamily hydrolase (TIGR01509 family)